MKKDFLQSWKKPGPKWLLLLYIFGAVMLLSGCVLIGLYFQARDEREIASLKTKFERIEIGMNSKKVEELIGRAPDHEDIPSDPAYPVSLSWRINGYYLGLICTRDGSVSEKYLSELWKPGLADYFELDVNTVFGH